jgi:Tripartite ATP-independent periplasmic transporter, DctM component
VAEKILPSIVPGMSPDDVMIWFGVIIAMNLQTSFLTPPFGFALFYLRSVAAKFDYRDRVTKELIPAVTTTEIYKGSIAFIILQLIMVAAIMAFPVLVTGGIEKTEKLNKDQVLEQLQMITPTEEPKEEEKPAEGAKPGEEAKPGDPLKPEGEKASESKEEDPMKAILEAMEKDKKK